MRVVRGEMVTGARSNIGLPQPLRCTDTGRLGYCASPPCSLDISSHPTVSLYCASGAFRSQNYVYDNRASFFRRNGLIVDNATLALSLTRLQHNGFPMLPRTMISTRLPRLLQAQTLLSPDAYTFIKGVGVRCETSGHFVRLWYDTGWRILGFSVSLGRSQLSALQK